MVEQWTENPCVPGSIPGGTTKPTQHEWVFCFNPFFTGVFAFNETSFLTWNISIEKFSKFTTSYFLQNKNIAAILPFE